MERADLPRLVAQALDELVAQRAGGGPLPSDDAAWAWALEEIAKEFPGATANWKGSAITLALPGRELALTLSQEPPAWRVGRGMHQATSFFAPDPEKENRLRLTLSDALDGAVGACETNCVAGCCGLDAFVVSRDSLAEWLREHTRDVGRRAADDLDAILGELARFGAGAEAGRAIGSERFNAVWSGAAECAEYLETWRGALLGALA